MTLEVEFRRAARREFDEDAIWCEERRVGLGRAFTEETGPPMRNFLLFVGWLSLIGSIADAFIAAYSLWVVGVGDWAEPGLSVEALFREHLPLLYPLKQLAYFVMPDDFASWAFSLPALALFPLRSVVSALFGQWVLATARRLR